MDAGCLVLRRFLFALTVFRRCYAGCFFEVEIETLIAVIPALFIDLTNAVRGVRQQSLGPLDAHTRDELGECHREVPLKHPAKVAAGATIKLHGSSKINVFQIVDDLGKHIIPHQQRRVFAQIALYHKKHRIKKMPGSLRVVRHFVFQLFIEQKKSCSICNWYR